MHSVFRVVLGFLNSEKLWIDTLIKNVIAYGNSP